MVELLKDYVVAINLIIEVIPILFTKASLVDKPITYDYNRLHPITPGQLAPL